MSVSFDRVAEIYDRTRSLPNHVMNQLQKTLTIELKDSKAILDVGVGTGRFAKPLQDTGFKIVGIDISKKMIGKAHEKHVSKLALGDARFLPFQDESFDAAVCVHLLHLITEWKMALKEICRVTQDLMISLFYARQDPVREAYNSLLREYGYERRRPGKSEQELRNLISPARSVFVSSYETSADKRLTNLAQGTSSSQWGIPVGINKSVVDKLRSQFAGRAFTQELYLLIWNIDDLKDYCEQTP